MKRIVFILIGVCLTISGFSQSGFLPYNAEVTDTNAVISPVNIGNLPRKVRVVNLIRPYFSGSSSSYVFAGAKTDDNLNTSYNNSEGGIARFRGSVLLNAYLQSYTRAEYSVTGVIAGRISLDDGHTWGNPFVIKSTPNRPVRNLAMGNVGGDTIGMVYKYGSFAPYDTISGLASLYVSDTIFYHYTLDTGRTWSTPVVIKSSTPGRSLLPSGNIVYSNGEIRFVAWDSRLAEIFKSTNRGISFATESNPYTTGTISDGTWNLFEPSFTYLGNNTFRLIARNQLSSDNADARYPVYLSTNNGASWPYQGILNLPTFNYWKYRTAPSTLTDFRDNKTYIAFGSRSQSATNSTGQGDSLWVIQDNIADVIANPLIATVKWKVERPTPKAFYFKAMPVMAPTSNGLSIIFTEALPDGSFTGALKYSLYHANIYNTSMPYSFKAITHKYENTGPVLNNVTLNYDFVKSPYTVGNYATDGTLYLNGQKAYNGVVINGLNYGLRIRDYAGASPGNTAFYGETVVPGATNFWGRFDQAGGLTLNTFGSSNFTIRYLNNPMFFMYPTTGNIILQNSGTFTEIASSRFTVNSTTQGSLPVPRMTTTQRTAITLDGTNDGLQVYDITLHKLYVNENGAWVQK